MDEQESYHWKIVGSAYDTFAESEEARLKIDSNPLEWGLAKAIIGRYLDGVSDVIDIGSGPGVYALWLARMGRRVKMIDVSERSLLLAEYRAKQSGLGNLISTQVGDAGNLDSEANETHDLALVLGPIYHSPDERYVLQSLREIFRVLRPGGFGVLNIVNPYSTLKKLYPSETIEVVKALLCDVGRDGFCYVKGEDDDIGSWLCTPEYIQTALQHNGFEICESAGSKAIFQDSTRPLAKDIKQDLPGMLDLLIYTSTIKEYMAQSEYIWVVCKKAEVK